MSFLQTIFESISLEKQRSLWLSEKDSDAENRRRIRLLSSHPECTFNDQFGGGGGTIKACAKNDRLAEALAEKARLAYAQVSNNYTLNLIFKLMT